MRTSAALAALLWLAVAAPAEIDPRQDIRARERALEPRYQELLRRSELGVLEARRKRAGVEDAERFQVEARFLYRCYLGKRDKVDRGDYSVDVLPQYAGLEKAAATCLGRLPAPSGEERLRRKAEAKAARWARSKPEPILKGDPDFPLCEHVMATGSLAITD